MEDASRKRGVNAWLARYEGEIEAARIFLYSNPAFVRGCSIAMKMGGVAFQQYYDGEQPITDWINARQVGLWELLQRPEFVPVVRVPGL